MACAETICPSTRATSHNKIISRFYNKRTPLYNYNKDNDDYYNRTIIFRRNSTFKILYTSSFTKTKRIFLLMFNVNLEHRKSLSSARATRHPPPPPWVLIVLSNNHFTIKSNYPFNKHRLVNFHFLLVCVIAPLKYPPFYQSTSCPDNKNKIMSRGNKVSLARVRVPPSFIVDVSRKRRRKNKKPEPGIELVTTSREAGTLRTELHPKQHENASDGGQNTEVRGHTFPRCRKKKSCSFKISTLISLRHLHRMRNRSTEAAAATRKKYLLYSI